MAERKSPTDERKSRDAQQIHSRPRRDAIIGRKIARILQRDTTPNDANSEEVRELKQKIVILQDNYERIGQGKTVNPKDIRKEVYLPTTTSPLKES